MDYKRFALKSIIEWSKENLNMNKSTFYDVFFPVELNNNAKYIIDHCEIKAKRIGSYFLRGDYDAQFYTHFNEFIKFHVKHKKHKLLNLLLSNLMKFDGDEAEKLYNYFRVQHVRIDERYITVKRFSDTLYQYFMFVMRNELPEKALLEGYLDYAEDLNQFVGIVIEGSGANCPNGHFAIYKLAKEGNLFALMEAADIAYHGYNVLGKVDYQEAFYYYNRSLELGKIHPLILFTLALMYLNYQDPEFEYKDAYIKEIDCLSVDERLEKVFEYLRIGVSWREGKAYNLLGLIYCDPKWSKYRKMYYSDSENAEYFYKMAIEANCVYGYINYAEYALEHVKRNEHFWSEKKLCAYYKLFIDNTIAAAKTENSIALLNMAKLYIDGAVYKEKVYLNVDFDKAYDMLVLATKSAPKYGSTYFESMQLLIKHYYLNAESERFLEISAADLLKDVKLMMKYDFDEKLMAEYRRIVIELESLIDVA